MASVSQAALKDLNPRSMKEVMKLAHAIAAVQPNLDDPKYLEYALGIHQASIRFNVDPYVIIAITQQESGFHEDLPEGRAGERGICQILKNWLQNPKFRAEFRRAKLSDLKKPSRSFQFAAYILRDLKSTIKSGTLPYWSFYNSKRFENRFKYFLLVNKYLASLRKFDKGLPTENGEARQIADVSEPKSRIGGDTFPPPVSAKWLAKSSKKSAVAQSDKWVPTPTTSPKVIPAVMPKGPNQWIGDALRKIHQQQVAKEAEQQGLSPETVAKKEKPISPSIMRAAAELDVSPILFQQKRVED